MDNIMLNSSVNSALGVGDFWHYTIARVGGHDIKTSNIILALLILTFSLKFFNKLSTFLLKILYEKFEDKDSAIVVHKIVTYIIFVILIITILEIANIPLSAFTFVSSAFAFGIGLGAQGFVNNFISGLVMMFEGPIKIGDIIETQGTIGRVQSIGSRCIVLDTLGAEEILIPNSNFLQNKISRWPLTENKIKYHVYINIIKPESSKVPVINVDFFSQSKQTEQIKRIDQNSVETKKIDHKVIIEQLTTAFKNISFIVHNIEPKIYLTKIGNSEDRFYCEFYCNMKLVNHAEKIMHEVNFALLNNLTDTFTVEYSKNLV